MSNQLNNPSSHGSIKTLKVGSLCRVTLPLFKEKLALGAVRSFQVVYPPEQKPYLIVWVEMLIEGRERPFEPENLEVMPSTLNGFDQELEMFKLSEAS